jgi:hypothetical protein
LAKLNFIAPFPFGNTKYGTGAIFTDDTYKEEDHPTQDEAELIDIYQKLLPPIQKDVLKYAHNMLDLQQLRNTKLTSKQPDLV